MASDLNTSGSSQSQSTTQNPQSGVQSLNTGAQSSSVQPGTTSSLLNSQGGVALHGGALSTVNLSAGTAASAVPAATAAPKHHVNGALIGIAVILLLIAAVMFWTTSRSVKSTT